MFVPQFEPLIAQSYADEVHKQIMSGWIGPGKPLRRSKKSFVR